MFDLDPLTPGKPSIHVIPDEIMLEIFNFLSMNTAMKLEMVCRRWMHLFTKYCRNQVIRRERGIDKSCAKDVFCNSYKKLNKVLNFAGDLIERLPSLSDRIASNVTDEEFSSYVSEKCPNLKSIDLNFMLFTVEYFENFVKKFIHLETLTLNFKNFEGENVKDRQVLSVLSSLKLKCLKLFNCDLFYIKLFDLLLPVSLETFICFPKNENMDDEYKYAEYFVFNDIQKLSLRCSNLTNLRLSFILSPDQIREIGQNFPKLEYFAFNFYKAEMSLREFRNLKELEIKGFCWSIEDLKPLSNLEIIKLYDYRGVHLQTLQGDFSVLKNIKEIEIIPILEDCRSISSLSKCKNLQRLHLGANNNRRYVKMACIEDIIKNCLKLRKLEIPFFEITSENLPNFKNAIKNRKLKLKLYLSISIKREIGLAYKIKLFKAKLTAANYDVDFHLLSDDQCDRIYYDYDDNY